MATPLDEALHIVRNLRSEAVSMDTIRLLLRVEGANTQAAAVVTFGAACSSPWRDLSLQRLSLDCAELLTMDSLTRPLMLEKLLGENDDVDNEVTVSVVD